MGTISSDPATLNIYDFTTHPANTHIVLGCVKNLKGGGRGGRGGPWGAVGAVGAVGGRGGRAVGGGIYLISSSLTRNQLYLVSNYQLQV